MKFAIIAAAMCLTSAAHAQSVEADSSSTSESHSGVYTQGDNIRSGSVGAPSANSTAPCVKGTSFGVAAVGAGVGFGSGRIDKECIIREEGNILRSIGAMPPGLSRDLVVTHFCQNIDTMRATLASQNLCPRAVKEVSKQYSACQVNSNGAIHVKVRFGGDSATAVAQCRAVLGR